MPLAFPTRLPVPATATAAPTITTGAPAASRSGPPAVTRRLLQLAVAVGLLWAPVPALAAVAGPADPRMTTADCDAPTHQRVLRPVPSADALPRHARAVALSADWLRWPGQPADGRYRLVHADDSQLQLRSGEPARGVTQGWVLGSGAEAPPALRAATAWVGAGADLSLPEAARRALPMALRGQLAVVREDAQGRVIEATRIQHALMLDALYAPAAVGGHFGADVVSGRTHYRVWAPTARQVALCRHGVGEGPAVGLQPLTREARTGAWTMRRPARDHGHSYTFLVDVEVPGVGRVRNRVTDPYARSLTPDSRHAVVVDPDAPDTQPPGWARTPRPDTVAAPTDLVIYELHVRDFSVGDTSVPPAQRGRYEAFALPDTHGVRHLRALRAAGLTDVHLLPVFDLATVPERGCVEPVIPVAAPDSEAQQAAAGRTRATDCFNWGYDPFHFNAPEGSYATPGAGGVQRVREFRRMVQALHAMGLRVGMDVVYNHMSASGQHPQSVLDRLVPGYYHRLNADGEVERSTCCDNTATEHRMMARLMIDSAVVWARDHRIDSFRFDLMGHQPREAMERLQQAVDRATGRRIHLIGEGWNFGEVADGRRFVQASQLSLNGSGIGTFNDRLRDAVRGGGAGDSGVDQIVRQGYVGGLHLDRNERAAAAGQGTREQLLQAADLVRAGLAGSIRHVRLEDHTGRTVPLEALRYGNQPAGYVLQPGEVVNYVENHDNQTLFDNLVFKLPLATPPEERARVQMLANAVLLFSQGIAYVHAGQELLRSKSMDRNSYDSGDAFNRLDWTAQDNFFGTGLPPREDNAASWPLMQPLLARADAIRPRPADIAWTRDTFLDLLRIRTGTTLLRLRSAEDIATRLRLLNTGPAQQPAVLAGHLDGQGYPGAGFRELLYLVNVDREAHELVLDGLKGRAWTLHPVLAAPTAADRRVREATADAATGRFRVPPRTAVVWVVN
jgi:pullulanase/glycogen debranching enzyme